MKKLIVMLLISAAGYAQQQVFNVQEYCVDQAPFKKGQCDVSGNEYSFVFMDVKKQQVTFFFTDTKFNYKILSAQPDQAGGSTIYTLEGEKGNLEMKVNSQQTKIEFLYPETRIYLTVGKSTKKV